MIDHISIAVRDLAASAAFYAHVLEPLGLTKMVERPGMVGFGRKYPEFWLNARPGMARQPDNPGAHVALRAPSEEAVTEFHTRALARGAVSDGAPGPRPAAMTSYFGAFILDPDGNKIEAMFFPKAG